MNSSPHAVDKEVNERGKPTGAAGERAEGAATPAVSEANTDTAESATPGAPGKGQSEPGSRSSPHEIESAADHKQVGGRVDRRPSEAKKRAGNYRKEHVRYEGLDITIETPAGARRSGKGADGKPWSVRMPGSYGYVKGTIGADEDHVDCLLGKGAPNGRAFIVDQFEPQSGKFDEHKIVLALDSPEAAVKLYQASFSGDASRHRMGAVTEVSITDLKHWLGQGARKEPFFKGGADLPGDLVHEGHGQAWVGRQTFAAAKKQVARTGSPQNKAIFADAEKRIAEIERRRAAIEAGSMKPEEKASKVAGLHKREISVMLQVTRRVASHPN